MKTDDISLYIYYTNTILIRIGEEKIDIEMSEIIKLPYQNKLRVNIERKN